MLLLCSLTADFVCTRTDMNGHKPNTLLRCLIGPDTGVLELTKSLLMLMLLYYWILGWAASSVSPLSIPQPAQKPHSLNVNDDKTPVKGDIHVFFLVTLLFLLSSRILYSVSCLLSYCHNKTYFSSNYSSVLCSLITISP